MRFTTTIGFVLGCLILSTACGDDDDDDAPRIDAGSIDGAMPDAGGPDAGPTAARGEYLVKAVLACSDCHTPRDAMGAPIAEQFLAGVNCFIDAVPGPGKNEAAGCLSSRNLTNHPTGLMNRTDDEIKDMIAHGERPDGSALFPIMPYYVFSTLTPTDLDSLVLYLRTVPGVDHTVDANQPPFDTRPPQPSPPLTAEEIVEPTVVNAATMRGQYLTTLTCMECHTKRTNPQDARSLDVDGLYAGGEGFDRDALGVPPFEGVPATIFTRNLTPHPVTGLGYTKEQILKVLKEGIDKNGDGVCPPMPYAMAAYGNLTEQDASDIADYILALPPVDNDAGEECVFNPPPPGP